VRSSLSFAGGTDMIMSLVRAEASSLVGGSVTAADIEEKAFMASDGTVVYIFSLRDDAYGDAMIEMLFEQRHEVHITMADSKAGGMAPFIEAFVEYTNASVITYPVSGNPPVSFGGNVTIFVTVPGAAAPYEHIDMMTSEGRATVYFADGIAGMPKFFAEWLPASEDLGKVRVGVADGEESYIGSLLDGFGNVTVQALSPLSFAGDVNVITSFAHIPKASLAGGDVTAEGIVEKAYVASDKTIVYIYMRGDAHETTDPLTDWLFSQKVQLHILQSKNREAEAKPVLNAFAGYANVELVITLWTTGHAPLNFTGGTEIIINDTDTLPPGVSVAQMVPSAYAYYENNPDGMVKLFVDWLSYRAG